jgi:hypothetical protein
MNARMDNWAEEAERRFNEQQQAMIAENDAQRRLRDAAPDLLACARKLRAVADWLPHPHCVEAIEMADAAIAKAKPNVKNPIDL